MIATLAGVLAAGAIWVIGPPPRVRLGGNQLSPTLFSPDSRWLVVEEWTQGGDRIQNLVVDTATGESRFQFPGRRLLSLAFSADGRLLARAADYTDSENGIDAWDLETGTEVERLRWRVMPGELNCNLPSATVCLSPQGRLLVGSVNFGVWDVESRRRIEQLEPLIPAGPMPSRHSTSLLGYHQERERVCLFSMKTRAVVSEFVLPGSLRNYCWSAGGRFLAADFYDRAGVHVADSRTGIWVPISRGEIGLVTSVAEDRPLLAVAGETEWGLGMFRWLVKEPPRRAVIRLFDASTGRLTDELPGLSPLLSPDGTTLAVRCRDGSLELWDLPRPTPWLRCMGSCLVAVGFTLLLQVTVHAARRSRQ